MKTRGQSCPVCKKGIVTVKMVRKFLRDRKAVTIGFPKDILCDMPVSSYTKSLILKARQVALDSRDKELSIFHLIEVLVDEGHVKRTTRQ